MASGAAELGSGRVETSGTLEAVMRKLIVVLNHALKDHKFRFHS